MPFSKKNFVFGKTHQATTLDREQRFILLRTKELETFFA
jgi:hypothetical protein